MAFGWIQTPGPPASTVMVHAWNHNTQELKTENQKFKVIFCYAASSRSAWYTWSPVKSQKGGWECSSVVEHLLGQCEARGSILAQQTNKQGHLDPLAFLENSEASLSP